MFGTVTKISLLLASAAISVRADPNPTNPAPGDVFIEGQSCAIGWDADPTGTWKKTQIDLMTGDNFNMVYLTTVAVVDTTNPSQTTYSYTCPKVTPHSPIYFYQFSAPSLSSNKSWTGRFTITDSPNDIVPPAQSTQPDGEKIPWGTGALVNGSSSLVPPTVSGSATAASSGSATPSPSTPSTPSGTPGPSASAPSSKSSMSVMTITSSVVVVPTTTVATPSAGANGAVALFPASNIVFQTGLVLGLAALGFAMVF